MQHLTNTPYSQPHHTLTQPTPSTHRRAIAPTERLYSPVVEPSNKMAHHHTPKLAAIHQLDHIEARHRLVELQNSYTPMTLPRLSSESLLYGINSEPLPNTGKMKQTLLGQRYKQNRQCANQWLAEQVAHCFNTQGEYALEKQVIQDEIRYRLRVSEDPGLQKFFKHNATTMKRSLHRAVEEVEKIVPSLRQIQIDKLEYDIFHAVAQYQYRAFLQHTPWETVVGDVESHLIDHFSNHHPFGHQLGHQLPHTTIQSTIKTIQSYTRAPSSIHLGKAGFSARFDKASSPYTHPSMHANHSLPGLPASSPSFFSTSTKDDSSTQWPLFENTQIMGSTGRLFALINTPTTKEAGTIHNRLGVAKDDGVLGGGSYGKVRYALDLHTGEIVAVKKIEDRTAADLEIAQFFKVGSCEGVINMLDYALTVGKEGNPKTYLFMPIKGSCDAFSAMTTIGDIRQHHPHVADQVVHQIAKGAGEAIQSLHQAGLYHHDIKPENLLVSGLETLASDATTDPKAINVTLIDLGFVEQPKQKCDKATICYAPPQLTFTNGYSSAGHDAYSFGMTLFALAHHGPITLIDDASLTIHGQPYEYQFMHAPDGSKLRCLGYTGPTHLKGETADEVIAMLTHQNPLARWSVEEALQKPYFML